MRWLRDGPCARVRAGYCAGYATWALALVAVPLALGLWPVDAAAVHGKAPARDSRQGLPLAVDRLVHDLERIVYVTEQAGWLIDTLEVRNRLPQALASVCRADPASRTEALAYLDHQITTLGGPAPAAFERNGRGWDGLVDLRRRSRERMLLVAAIDAVDAHCPYWITPSEGFLGLQGDAGRWSVHAGGGGYFSLAVRGRDPLPAGGGGGRLMLGRGTDGHWSTLFGGEWGGAGVIEDWRRTQRFDVQTYIAVPVAQRYTWSTWHIEGELAPVVNWDLSDGIAHLGGRIGVLVGVSGIRFRNLVPWAGFGVHVQQLYRTHGVLETAVRAGAQVGVMWDAFGAD